MGGLGPGIGGGEWIVIGIVALVVVGPERLPGLLRQLGKMVAKARGMANEFRASFDEMARQSELDELRKEVEALRTSQNSPVRAVEQTFQGVRDEFDKPLFADTPAATPVVPETVAEPVMTPTASEWPDGEPVMMPVATPPLAEAEPVPAAAKPAAKARAAKPRATAPKTTAKAATSKAAPKARSTAAAPRKSKLDQ